METVRILSGKQISRDYIAQALELDRISYDDIYQLDVDTCVGFYEKNSDIYIMAVDESGERVIGYINFSPVIRSLYTSLASGQVVDTVVTGPQIPKYRRNRCYWAYFSSIVVHPDFRQHGIATRMLMAWSELVCRLAKEKDIYFHSVVADAVSSVGEHILGEIGFTLQKSSSHQSKIMTVDFFSEEVSPSKFNRDILEAYRMKKQEKGDA